MAGHSKLLAGFQTIMLVLSNDTTVLAHHQLSPIDVLRTPTFSTLAPTWLTWFITGIFLHQQDVYIIKKYMESQKQLLICGARFQF